MMVVANPIANYAHAVSTVDFVHTTDTLGEVRSI